jgi:hypothetical protein
MALTSGGPSHPAPLHAQRHLVRTAAQHGARRIRTKPTKWKVDRQPAGKTSRLLSSSASCP